MILQKYESFFLLVYANKSMGIFLRNFLLQNL